MADQLAPVLWRAVDSNGDPVPGAQATWEESGTTTPLTVYQNDALSSAHATPQVADGSGIFDQVFVTSGTAAKVTVRDPADGSVLYVIDPVPLTSTGGQSASNINFAAVTGNSATDTQSAIANNVTRINRLDNGSALATSGGSGGAYTMSSTFAITAYAARQEYEFVANHASVGGGTDTLNIDAVGSVVLKKYEGSTSKADLAAGDIATGDKVRVKHDGTHFVVISALSAGEATKGLVEVATTAEMTAGAANKFPDAAKIKTYVDASSSLTLGTVSTTTGGTEIDFTDIPAGVNEVDVYIDGLSMSGTDHILVQIGDSGGIETTGYVSASQNDAAGVSSTAGFVSRSGGASDVHYGVLQLRRMTGNKWVSTANVNSDSSNIYSGAGRKELSAELDRVRITTTGTNTFDANAGVNISYR